MNNRPISSYEEWAKWIEVQKAAIREVEVSESIQRVEEYLRSEPPVDLRRQALGFRGSLRQEEGELEGAMADFLAARALTEKPDFERYTLEQSAATISQQLGQTEEAERWNVAALETAAADPTTSGAAALRALLTLRAQAGLEPDEEELARRVVRQAWHLLRVEGEPDLSDLHTASEKLLAAQSRAFSVERPPEPKSF